MKVWKVWTFRVLTASVVVGSSLALFIPGTKAKWTNLPVKQVPSSQQTAASLAPPFPIAPKRPSEPPVPPPALASDPWLKVQNPPGDCAPQALDVDCFKPGTWWVWKVGTNSPAQLEIPQQLKMSIWAVPADGAIAVYSARQGWFLARTEDVHPEWVWVYVPDPTERNIRAAPENRPKETHQRLRHHRGRDMVEAVPLKAGSPVVLIARHRAWLWVTSSTLVDQ